MQDAKHTPGPWLYEHDAENGTMTVWAGSAIEDRHSGMYDSAGEMELYTSVYEDDGEHFVECQANARLIASAPELLAALNSLLLMVKEPEPVGRCPDTGYLEYANDADHGDAAEIFKARAAIAKATGSEAA